MDNISFLVRPTDDSVCYIGSDYYGNEGESSREGEEEYSSFSDLELESGPEPELELGSWSGSELEMIGPEAGLIELELAEQPVIGAELEIEETGCCATLHSFLVRCTCSVGRCSIPGVYLAVLALVLVILAVSFVAVFFDRSYASLFASGICLLVFLYGFAACDEYFLGRYRL